MGPVYEVTHTIDPEIADDFDGWLALHIEAMLELPGIGAARGYTAGEDPDGRPRRVTHYVFDTEEALERYLDGAAAEMRGYAVDRFGGKFSVERRTLRETGLVDTPPDTAERCLNCGAPLAGQYCGQCGQRARSRLISIWELTREAFGDLFELDSRLWRTLVPLAIRPGKLTREYLEGRRARYMPPFRTYLVLSLFFFVIAFFDPREELGILFEPEAPAASAESAGDTAETAESVRQDVMDELVEEGLIPPEQAADTGADTREPAEDSNGVNIMINENRVSSASDCNDVEVEDIPEWARSRLTPERVKLVCERVTADDGRAFVAKLLDNVPAALFILLPLMALILKLLYPLSKRYYVEHLLFVVHFHAFVFLILTLQILFGRLAAVTGLNEAVSATTSFAVSIYIPVYLFKAMRRVYAQGHFFTLAKFLVLFAAYTTGLSLIFLFAALFAAFSI